MASNLGRRIVHISGDQDIYELSHGCMEKLLLYLVTTKPKEYRWEGPGSMKEIVDSFSKYLMDHLYGRSISC